MVTSSLHYSDSPRERHEFHHNPKVAHLLGQAYSHLQQASSNADAYDQAYALAKACFALTMSKRQRMRVHYAFASASLGLDDDPQGITQLNQAIELAAELPDPGAYAELAHLAAAASHRLFHNRAAIEYAGISLGILHFVAKDQVSLDAELEIDVLIDLAASEFELMSYPTALQHLQTARPLTALLPQDHQTLGPVLWMEALLLRWSGQPELALHHTLAAIDIYSSMKDSPSSVTARGRLSGILSESALDLAESFPGNSGSTGRTTYVELARPFVEQAMRYARESNDIVGQHVAALAQVRFDGVTNRNVDRILPIEDVIRHARNNDDASLLAQSYTALGREYFALGQPEQALGCFRRAVDAVRESDILAMAAFAQRRLLLEQEMLRDYL